MAWKTVFVADSYGFYEKEVEYTFFPGFAPSQKQKNVRSLHESIISSMPRVHPLEISTKSTNPLGVRLSAFNLLYNGIPVESIFQSSKVFLDGTQFKELFKATPRDARKYVKEHSPGPLRCFSFQGREYPLSPKSAFYDFIYLKALSSHEDLAKELIQFDCFTDIEFNSAKSINCQARSCAIYVYLQKSGELEERLSSFDSFVGIYSLADI